MQKDRFLLDLHGFLHEQILQHERQTRVMSKLQGDWQNLMRGRTTCDIEGCDGISVDDISIQNSNSILTLLGPTAPATTPFTTEVDIDDLDDISITNFILAEKAKVDEKLVIDSKLALLRPSTPSSSPPPERTSMSKEGATRHRSSVKPHSELKSCDAPSTELCVASPHERESSTKSSGGPKASALSGLSSGLSSSEVSWIRGSAPLSTLSSIRSFLKPRMRNSCALAEAAVDLASATEREALQGQEAVMLSFLIVAFVIIVAIVELFVRSVVNPKFKVDYSVPNPARPLRPDLAWEWSWTGKGATGHWSDESFVSLQCALSWITSVMLGLGLEFLVGFKLISMSTSITESHEHMWLLAQFIFPFMILVSIIMSQNGNAWSLAFGTLGMWKFGFPETLAYTSKVIKAPYFDIKLLSDLFNALGFLAHHSSSMLFVAVFTLGLSPITRPVYSASLPLVVQHMVIGMKYVSFPIYVILEFVLEIWFELEAFAILEILFAPHGVPVSVQMPFTMYHPFLVRVFCGMILAHWMYWIAAFLSLIERPRVNKEESEGTGTVAEWGIVFREPLRARSDTRSDTRSV